MGSLTQTARDFINNGEEKSGRHKAIWHTTKSLHEAGCDLEEARAAILWGNEVCRPPFDVSQPDNEVDKILAQVYLDTSQN
jgi:hypothetical protein